MSTIYLSNGLTAEVDEADLPLVLQYNWHGQKSRNKKYYYAVANVQKSDAALLGMNVHNRKGSTRISLHRLIMGAGPRIDHKNGNALDCRRENMRWATCSQNGGNMSKRAGDHRGAFSSKYKGVALQPSGRWKVIVGSQYVGVFDTEVEAAKAYDQRAVEIWGEYARTNFPIETASQPLSRFLTQDIYDEVRRLFHERHLSQIKIGKRLGISNTTVCKILKGKIKPRLVRGAKLSRHTWRRLWELMDSLPSGKKKIVGKGELAKRLGVSLWRAASAASRLAALGILKIEWANDGSPTVYKLVKQ